MGCFLSSKTYIEEKIEECERYLTLSKKSINEIKQAFFLLNEGEFISQKALQKALFNLNLQYSEKIVDFIVYPFFQSLAFIKNKDNTNKGELIEINKKKEIIEKDNIFILEEELKEFLLIPLKREYFEFNKIISVFYMLSNEKSLVKAIDLFKLFKKLGKKKMDKIEIENFLKYLFETVAVYSLVFAEIKPRLIDKICKNIAENIKNEVLLIVDWLYADYGEFEIDSDYFSKRITQFELYLGYSIMQPKGIRRRIMPFIFMKIEEIDDFFQNN